MRQFSIKSFNLMKTNHKSIAFESTTSHSDIDLKSEEYQKDLVFQ